MDPNWRPTLFDVDSYPILRDIARWSESAPSRQAAFVDSNGARQNIDRDAGGALISEPLAIRVPRTRPGSPDLRLHAACWRQWTERVPSGQAPFVDTSWHSQSIDRETEGLSPQGHALSQFPQPGGWGHPTYDNVQQVGVSGRLRTEQVGYYPLWQYGNPGLGGLPRPETIPSEGAEHQGHSNHHNEVSPHQLMPSALFQQQQQQQMQHREQQPAPHDTESEFTSQVETNPRDIPHVSERVSSEQVPFVDTSWHSQSIDRETEGLSPQGHALSQFPQPGQWGHRTYDNVQQVGLSGRLRTEQVGYYPLWQYGNPGFEGLARPETIPSERAEHQDHSNHHNEVSPHQLMPYALFQQQQQQMQDREQQPAPHDTESEFTSQVESYPPQREISGVTESVTSEEVSFVDIDGPPENIDEETGVSGQNTKFFRPWE
ncbi:hypothetical protein MRX96_025637 [Rhipicephalus microplus]